MDISEATRRNVADELSLSGISWSGRFAEDDFLTRLYDLREMSSNDYRYSNASGDIFQHRVRNNDWDDNWVFTDDRFNLLRCEDEEFLRFLCETTHPVVQPDAEKVATLIALYNHHIAKDGWELFEQTAISGKPVFAARRLIEGAAHAIAAAGSIADHFDAGYVNTQVTRLQQALSGDPELAIGTAKEFVETVAKAILDEHGVVADPEWDLLRLVRRAMEMLNLVPESVDEKAKAATTIKALLGNLASIAQRIAELRNPYGTGHGKGPKAKGLQLRHARLAVSAATTLAVFLFETHQSKTEEEC